MCTIPNQGPTYCNYPNSCGLQTSIWPGSAGIEFLEKVLHTPWGVCNTFPRNSVPPVSGKIEV